MTSGNYTFEPLLIYSDSTKDYLFSPSNIYFLESSDNYLHIIYGIYDEPEANVSRSRVNTLYHLKICSESYEHSIQLIHTIDPEGAGERPGLRFNAYIDRSDNIHVLWRKLSHEERGGYIRSKIDGNWQPTFRPLFSMDPAWSAPPSPLSMPIETNFIVDDEGTFHLSGAMRYDLPGEEEPRDLNTVLYTFSEDSGKTFVEFERVMRTYRKGASNTKLLMDNNNTLHYFWGRSRTDDSVIPQNIYHSYRIDEDTWAEPVVITDKLSLNGNWVGHLKTSDIDSNNNIYIVFSKSFLGREGTLYLSYYDGNFWRKPLVLQDGNFYGTNPQIYIDDDDYIHIVWPQVYDRKKTIIKYIKANTRGLQWDDVVRSVPESFALKQNYPNPFNTGTNIQYELYEDDHVTIEIYDVAGRHIVTLVDEFQEMGRHEVHFDGTNLPSGVYYYTIIFQNNKHTKSMVLVK